MEIKVDTKADALYICLKKGKVYRTVQNEDLYLIDLDKKGAVIGIEVLNYSKSVPNTADNISFSVVGRNKLITA